MKTITVLLFLALSFTSMSQIYGNEWINYNQKYYSFKLVQEGIYKIDYQTLLANNINPSLFTSGNIQIFGREKEQPVYMYDGGDNRLDSGDFFIFYVKKNDGWLDSTLYRNPKDIGNPGQSLFSDTIHYFFTWNNSENNLRFINESSVNYSMYPESNYVLDYQYFSPNWSFNPGRVSHINPSSLFDPGEGLSSGEISSYTHTFDVSNLFLGDNGVVAPNCVLHFKCSSLNTPQASGENNHHTRLSLGNTIIEDTIYSYYQHIIYDTVISPSFLNSNNNFKFEIVYDLTPLDKQAINYLSLKHPKKLKLNGANFDNFEIVNHSSGRIRMHITNSSITRPIMLVFGQKPKFINTFKSNDTIYALVSNSINGQNQAVVVSDSSLIRPIGKIQAVNGSGSFKDFSSINFNAANLMVYPPKFRSGSDNPVDNYIIYRSKNYNVVDANIEELYLQFGGGIPQHSNAIRRFALYAYNKALSEKPLAITILGKGLRYDNTRNHTPNYGTSLIPPFGSPGSDVFYTSFLQGNNYDPLIPIGRVSVSSPTDLQDYLDKLKEYEAQQDSNSVYNSETKDWQKQILHFIGGNANETPYFKIYMDAFKNTIEGKFFGANVTSFLKNTPNALDPSLVGEISNYIKYGASIMNFFGHASSTGFDINIDDPTKWENKGKYPVIIGNGCYVGAMYEQPYYYFAETIIETPNAGGIAYFASGGTEYDVTVKEYCGELYRHIAYKNYGKPFAFQIKESIKDLQQSSNINLVPFHSTFGATNLNGDPLLKVNYHNKPEIELLEQNVSFSPNTITLDVDSINVNIILTNLGKSVTDTFLLDLKRDFPLVQSDSSYTLKLAQLHYKDTISFKIPLQPEISIGLNKFDISCDIPSGIAEQYDEINNNQITKNFYLKVDGILPVLPYEFAVVKDSLVNVIASTINPIAGMKTYLFELDTTDLFNSPALRKKSITANGGVIPVKWNEWMNNTNSMLKPLICSDSSVYFWRVAIDSSNLFWTESSFQYIKNKEGWGQDHFFQFKNNQFLNVEYNREERLRKFKQKAAVVIAKVYDHPQNLDQIYNTLYSVNGTNGAFGDYGMCYNEPSLHLVIINPITLTPYLDNCKDPNGLSFGQKNDGCACRSTRSEGFFIFRQDSLELNLLYNVLTNPQFKNHYFLIYAVSSPLFDEWKKYSPQLYTWFQNQGSSKIDTAKNFCFIFFTQEGNSSITQEIQAKQYNEFITLTANIQGIHNIGFEKSGIIGPAKEWKTIYWKQHSLETPSQDTSDITKLKITGINYTSNTSFVYETVFSKNDSIINFNNIINAGSYPFLKLEATYIDSVYTTPAQNDRWHVLYSPVPEAAIDNKNPYTLSPIYDTIREGQEFVFAADYRNISTVHMDSMLVHYWIEDAYNKRHYINYPRQDSLLVGETFRDTITINTTGFPGLNSLWMEINPYIDANYTVTDQLEQHHFNNVLQIPFYVKGDNINPILDVSFDGRRILNGDIVSPKAEIVITLKDENPYLVMDNVSDTTLFGIYLREPGGQQKRIPFMNGNGEVIMQWIPADAKNKKFKIIYNGNFIKDGMYELWVQGTDRSGNLSGDIEYRITFEVINESTITYLMNYPNPFSTSTRFVFTLTGTEKPDDIIIQIMTVTGKVVREITEDEIGPVYIGRNVTQFAWNGTDEFGDALANGVYLYRVLSRINGKEIKLRESGADKYFKKEFGKMYLMR